MAFQSWQYQSWTMYMDNTLTLFLMLRTIEQYYLKSVQGKSSQNVLIQLQNKHLFQMDIRISRSHLLCFCSNLFPFFFLAGTPKYLYSLLHYRHQTINKSYQPFGLHLFIQYCILQSVLPPNGGLCHCFYFPFCSVIGYYAQLCIKVPASYYKARLVQSPQYLLYHCAWLEAQK